MGNQKKWPYRQYIKVNINKSRAGIFIRANLKEQIRLKDCKNIQN
jgi:hypothetical protein